MYSEERWTRMSYDERAMRQLARRLGWGPGDGAPGAWVHRWESHHGAEALIARAAANTLDWTGMLRRVTALWLGMAVVGVMSQKVGLPCPPIDLLLGAVMGSIIGMKSVAEGSFRRLYAYRLLNDPVWRTS